MNPRRLALLALQKTKVAELQALSAKSEALTGDEKTKVKALTEEIKANTAELAELKASDDVLAEALGQITVGAGSVRLSDLGAEGEIEGGVLTRSGKKVGTDVVAVFDWGHQKIDNDSFGLSEKQWYATQEDSYRKAHREYLRKGDKVGATALKELTEHGIFKGTAMETGVDGSGGFLVPPQMIMEIIAREAQPSDVMDLVRTIPCSSNKLIFPKLDYTTDDIYSSPLRIIRTGETQVPQPATRPDVGVIEIDIHEGSMELPLSRTLLDDAAIDVSAWVAEMFNEAFSLGTESELISGDGSGKPLGIIGAGVGGTGQIPTYNIGNPVTADKLTAFFYQLTRQYRGNASLLLEDQTLYATLAQLKDTAGNYIFGLFKTTDGGMATPRGEVFLGKPIKFSPFMATGGAAQNIAVWGDFKKAYYYGLRMGLTLEMQKLPRDAFAYAVLRFRNGGKTVQPRALRVGVQS